jgi:hypothetical protein
LTTPMSSSTSSPTPQTLSSCTSRLWLPSTRGARLSRPPRRGCGLLAGRRRHAGSRSAVQSWRTALWHRRRNTTGTAISPRGTGATESGWAG